MSSGCCHSWIQETDGRQPGFHRSPSSRFRDIATACHLQPPRSGKRIDHSFEAFLACSSSEFLAATPEASSFPEPNPHAAILSCGLKTAGRSTVSKLRALSNEAAEAKACGQPHGGSTKRVHRGLLSSSDGHQGSHSFLPLQLPSTVHSQAPSTKTPRKIVTGHTRPQHSCQVASYIFPFGALLIDRRAPWPPLCQGDPAAEDGGAQHLDSGTAMPSQM